MLLFISIKLILNLHLSLHYAIRVNIFACSAPTSMLFCIPLRAYRVAQNKLPTIQYAISPQPVV